MTPSYARFLNTTLSYGLSEPIKTPHTTLYFVAFVLPLILISLLLIPGSAPIPTFTISLPEVYEPEKYDELEVLDEPSIKISGSNTIQCYAPATGQLLGRVNPLTASGIDRAVAKAHEAQAIWARSSFAHRNRVLRCLLQHILDNADTIARVACMDSGKTRTDAALGEIMVTVDKIRWAIRNGEAALRTERRSVRSLVMLGKGAEVRWSPLGVVCACISWNYPFHNALNPIITTIITGNALLLKPSEHTTHSTLYYLTLVRAALQTCSAPANLIQAVPCLPATADHLTSHPGIAHITFIGSRPVAHLVAASAPKCLTPCTLELGGKDPAIVLDDCPVSDLSRVASLIMRGVFQAAGQNCVGIERVLAQPKVHDRLLAILEPRVRALKVGSALDDGDEDLDVGALISGERVPHLERLVADAVNGGAVLHVGGKRWGHPRWPAGHYFAPTLLSGVRPDMRIAQEELFAPIMLVFDPSCLRTTKEVVEVANGTEYALGSSVFGRHGSTAVEKVVRGLRCGMVSVGDVAGYYLCGLPFGGGGGNGGASSAKYHGSGYGRFGGVEGLRSVCAMKSVARDGWWGVFKTSVPGRLDYGGGKESPKVREAKRWAFALGVIFLAFGASMSQQARGLWQVLKTL